MDQQWFTPNDATPHTANAILELLKQKFGHRVISPRTNDTCAAHSSDPNTLDFFISGYAKDHVYAGKQRILQKLKSAIAGFIKAILADMCE